MTAGLPTRGMGIQSEMLRSATEALGELCIRKLPTAETLYCGVTLR